MVAFEQGNSKTILQEDRMVQRSKRSKEKSTRRGNSRLEKTSQNTTIKTRFAVKNHNRPNVHDYYQRID